MNKQGGLSPGKFTEEYAEKAMKLRRRNQHRAMLPSTKRRRLCMKQDRAMVQGANEALEGETYQSGMLHPNKL